MDDGRERILFSGYTVLRTAGSGFITTPEQGLFHLDTRLLSTYRLRLDGVEPQPVWGTQPESDRWSAVLRVARPGGTADGPALPQDTVVVGIDRLLGPGFVDELTICNHSPVAASVQVDLALDADFVDVLELRDQPRTLGHVERVVCDEPPGLVLQCTMPEASPPLTRGLWVRVVEPASTPVVSPQGFRFDVALEPRGTWHATLRFEVLEDGQWRSPEAPPARRRDRQRSAWRRMRPTVAGTPWVQELFERAADDLFDLRNFELEHRLLATDGGGRWVVNAGIPMFTGLFGRDVITAGWQSALLGVRALRGALDAVAATRAMADDPWRDAEPGKLIHELRTGPLSRTGRSPRDAYYGTQTTPAMFVLGLSELWHWTGDLRYVRRHRQTALDALAWADRYGDRDGDGWLEYERRSPEGLRNQGWKDSDEAIRHADGTAARGPIATVEEQAFRILALERMASMLVALGESRTADRSLEQADTLRSRWHDAYWMPDEHFYALALDGDKRQVRSITSNPGHALGAGVVPRQDARAVADRLLAHDMFSGWGVRSLSTEHPSYNPFAYHLGAVWPVEQATFALGCKRYGLDDQMDRIVGGLLNAAARSPDGRLPEALSGHARPAHGGPVPYPAANSPQAWSASALVQALQITLGLYPFAPLHLLAVVRPRLPAGIPELELRGLRVGRSTVDIEFRRRADGSASWRARRRGGTLLVLPFGPPDGAPSDITETLAGTALRHAPGRLARAARIALGSA